MIPDANRLGKLADGGDKEQDGIGQNDENAKFRGAELSIFRSGRMELLENSVRPRIELILPLSEIFLSETEMDYVKYSIAAILMAVLYVWYQHGCKETASELASIYNRISNVRYHYK